MSRGDAQRWNARYARDGEAWLRHPPKQLLLDYIHFLPPQGRVLDAALGVGSNSEFLAQKGFQVVLMDISWVGMCLAHDRFHRKGLQFKGAFADFEIVHLRLIKKQGINGSGPR